MTLCVVSAHVSGDSAAGISVGTVFALVVAVAAVYRRGLGFAAITLPRDQLAPHTPAGLDDAVLLRTSPAGAAAVRDRLRPLAPGVAVLPRSAYQVGLGHDLAESGWTQRMVTAVLLGYAIVAAGQRADPAHRRPAPGAGRAAAGRGDPAPAAPDGAAGAGAAARAGAGRRRGGRRGDAGADGPGHHRRADPVRAGGRWVAVLGGTVLLSVLGTALPLRRLLRDRPVEATGLRE